MASINASTSGAGGVITTADNTGILNIQTAGTTAVTIDASQNVGIGTTSPNQKLTINAPSAAEAAITMRGNGATNTSEFFVGQSNDNNAYVYNRAAKPLIFGTSDTERMRIDTSGYITNAVSGMGNGLVQGSMYYRLNSTYAGSNSSTAQSLFGVGVTLAGGTQYEFEIVSYLAKTAGTTSHTVGYVFGGTATFNNAFITYNGSSNDAPALTNLGVTNTPTTVYVNTGAITSATEYVSILAKGTISINTGGTFIPQYKLSAAPGGAYTTQIGSYIKISPIGASGANVSIGTWA
jgi:hypothetical protein